MWAVGFLTNVNQTNKQKFANAGHWSSAKSPQICRWYEPSLLAASVLYKFSISMDESIILATIATIAGNYKEMYIVTYVNIIVTNIN